MSQPPQTDFVAPAERAFVIKPPPTRAGEKDTTCHCDLCDVVLKEENNDDIDLWNKNGVCRKCYDAMPDEEVVLECVYCHLNLEEEDTWWEVSEHNRQSTICCETCLLREELSSIKE